MSALCRDFSLRGGPVSDYISNVRRLLRIGLFCFSALLCNACHSQQLTYEASLESATAKALSEGKLVIAIFGRPDCYECIQSKKLWETNWVRSWIHGSAVLWDANIDEDHWQAYAPPPSSLPLVVWLDPANTNMAIDKRVGLQTPFPFTRSGTNAAFKYLPIWCMNLPGDGMDAESFEFKGIARTNALAAGAVVGQRITNVFWALEQPGTPSNSRFQAVQALNYDGSGAWTWSQEAALQPGTNVFATYAAYANGRTSLTNRALLYRIGNFPATPLTLSIGLLNRHQATLTLHGAPGRSAKVESSSDLQKWQQLDRDLVTGDSTVIPLPTTDAPILFFRAGPAGN